MLIVTGGAGFIGSNIVAALEDRGETEIVVVDRLRDGIKWKNIAKRNLRDIVHPDDLPAFLEKHSGDVEAIFHMGAISATTEADADKILNNNLKLTTWLWEWCSRHSARLIYASSAATYGDGKQGSMTALMPTTSQSWHRLMPMAGRNMRPTAGSVAFSIRTVSARNSGRGLNSLTFMARMSIIRAACGRSSRRCLTSCQPVKRPHFFKSHHPDYEDGGQLRDFVWVGDVVNIIMWLYDNPEVSDLFNIGTGKARSFKDLALAVFSAMGKEPVINYIPTPEAIRDKYQYFTEANMAKLRKAGYAAEMTSLEEGVRLYIQDYLATEDPFR